jgi:AcrR family transcriptional regulator
MTDFLWGPHPRPARGPKPALSLDRIADAAIAIADAEGLAAVSMQRVAAALGFTKMSLYRYLPGRTELTALMVERAIGAPPAPATTAWREGLRAWAHALLAAHLRHPWTLEAVTANRPVGPQELSWMETALMLLAPTELTGSERLDTIAVLVGQVQVIARQAAQGARPEAHQLAAITTALRDRADDFPALAAAMSAESGAGRDQAFEFGLDRIMDGLQVLMDSRRPLGPPSPEQPAGAPP